MRKPEILVPKPQKLLLSDLQICMKSPHDLKIEATKVAK
jgi:hypothetical protein